MVYFSNSFIMKLQIDDEHGSWTQEGMRNHPCCYLCCYLCCDWATKKGLIVVQRAVPNDSIVLLILDKTSQNSSSFVTVFPTAKVKYNNLFLFTGNSQLCMMQRNGEKNVLICLRAQHQAPSHTFSLKIERISRFELFFEIKLPSLKDHMEHLEQLIEVRWHQRIWKKPLLKIALHSKLQQLEKGKGSHLQVVV